MNDLDREHLLQKVVAVSGFLFALLILPIAQYMLVNGREGVAEKGAVAGVSTGETVLGSVVADDPVACQATKEKDLRELQEWSDSRLLALQRDYNAAIAPYEQAIPLVTGQNVEQERGALSKLIAGETVSYNAKKEQIAAAVDGKVSEISRVDCGTVPAE
ncbi:MAG TPA: hypothetical protein VLA04_04810 [Verrucomicrobiae bacterium]|nr:hypothetical protein [Verrucomicrobiae bacterium]